MQKNYFSSALTGPETGPKPSIYFFIFVYFYIIVAVASIRVDLLSFLVIFLVFVMYSSSHRCLC